jgi:hypothetical protein
VASDITLRVVDPVRRVVVVEAWIGMSATRDRAREVLARAPDVARAGWECWGSVGAAEALAIAETAYADGATTADVQRWLDRYPVADHWWIIEHDC